MSERLSLLATQIDPNSPYRKFDEGKPEAKERWVSQSGTVDIEAERRKATFDPRSMNIYLHDGKYNAELREKMLLQFERDPTFRMDNVHDLTRPEVRERVIRRLKSMAHYISTEPMEQYITRQCVLILVDPGFMTRIAVHFGLFYNTILQQGTPEQVKHWVDKGGLQFKNMIGCFAMTEIGHGSNVAGLETTATLDEDTDEFVIHSPTLTSTKFWIGGAAESATHATVFANLIVKGKKYGVKPFVVQVRDPETFDLMPGVNIGDIGHKMGRNEIDNGWIRFTYVRVPRTNMLMKYTQVTKSGGVTEPAMSQLAYGALMFGRTAIVRESVEMAKKAITIAIRYAVVRRQFGGTKETQIMDYKTHQLRLINLLASIYGMQFAALQIRKDYEHMLKELSSADPKSMGKTLDNLKQMHATSAGLKALVTWNVLGLIETCRQSLGGMGYLAYSGLSAMYQDHAVQCTWEGDNTVLTLQTGRYLVGCLRDLKAGKKLPAGVAYLNDIPNLRGKSLNSSDVASLDNIQAALDVTCAHLVLQAGKSVESFAKSGSSFDESLEKSSAPIFTASKLHTARYLFKAFVTSTLAAPADIQPSIKQLCVLFGLSLISENAGQFLQFGFLKPEHMSQVQVRMLEVLDALRPQVIPLTDAFGLSDYVINSPLGCYDGDVYRRLMDTILKNNPQGQHPYFERTIKAALQRKEVPREVIQLDI